MCASSLHELTNGSIQITHFAVFREINFEKYVYLNLIRLIICRSAFHKTVNNREHTKLMRKSCVMKKYISTWSYWIKWKENIGQDSRYTVRDLNLDIPKQKSEASTLQTTGWVVWLLLETLVIFMHNLRLFLRWFQYTAHRLKRTTNYCHYSSKYFASPRYRNSLRKCGL
jgi:hypothetical protein